MNLQKSSTWNDFLAEEMKKEYCVKLKDFVNEEYHECSIPIFPQYDEIFAAFKKTPLSKCKVVILGQDPYHEYGQANGLAFSVSPGCKIPPSLQNIYKELHNDLQIDVSGRTGDLTSWAEQGVLLLNTTLTVREHQAASHYGKGWETFTDNAIRFLDEQEQPLVFILWGSNARKKKALIHGTHHYIIESAHPSPLSVYRGFFGSKPFSKANEYLIKENLEPINW